MSLEHDWRFAELVARAWTEDGLRERYATHPHAVLAEAGITLPTGSVPPELPADDGMDIVVDAFGTSTATGSHGLVAAAPATETFFCLSLVDEPQSPAGRVTAGAGTA